MSALVGWEENCKAKQKEKKQETMQQKVARHRVTRAALVFFSW